MPNNLLRQPNFAALVTLVWLLVALALLLQFWTQTAETLLDTDDAMRLAQLRGWLGGQGWFDLHQARMQPPEGYDTHWSRLIDAGLAGLLFLFGQFTDGASAERLMRAWWPLLWLLPTIAGMAAIAWRVAGREAATVALLLALVGVPAYQQFTPGRIDHHNVQIALTMLTVAATVWSDRWRWGPTAAGLLSGAAMAIGFEVGALSRLLRRGVRAPLCGQPGERRRSRFVWLVADGGFDRGLLRHHRGAALAASFLRQHRGRHARRGDVRRPDTVAGRLAQA